MIYGTQTGEDGGRTGKLKFGYDHKKDKWLRIVSLSTEECLEFDAWVLSRVMAGRGD